MRVLFIKQVVGDHAGCVVSVQIIAALGGDADLKVVKF